MEELGSRNAVRMTDYVSTRWYRAPEVLLKLKNYSKAMDMWSVGCILAELLLRKPFLAGTSTTEQIQMVCEAAGTPTREEIERIAINKSRETLFRQKLSSGTLDAVFGHCNPNALDLLKKLLQFHPEGRITVTEALEHPYLSVYHCAEDEPVA